MDKKNNCCLVDLDKIVNPNYRPGIGECDRAVIETIVNDYSPNLFKPVLLSYRNGVYYCVDGRNRVEAYRRMHKEKIKSNIIYGLKEAEEARLLYQKAI